VRCFSSFGVCRRGYLRVGSGARNQPRQVIILPHRSRNAERARTHHATTFCCLREHGRRSSVQPQLEGAENRHVQGVKNTWGAVSPCPAECGIRGSVVTLPARSEAEPRSAGNILVEFQLHKRNAFTILVWRKCEGCRKRFPNRCELITTSG